MKMISISEFYEGKNIFVTGATGFMGKVLLEKILRSCPGVGNIYVLIRPKKGKSPSDRIEDIVSLPLFDIIKRERPQTLKKIVPLSGDCAELGLGLSASDRQLLEEMVSVVFHAAANVRFDDPLKSAALLNTRGTREVMMIARHMKSLKVFVHVSTTYCNCDRTEVQEMIYPPHANWRDIISIVEHVDEHILNTLTPKILCNLPNTYTFTKSLAEHVVKDLGKNLPVVIFRPSIIITSQSEPFPGWVDNFNGPVGLMIAGGKGFLRKSFGDPSSIPDFVPVDFCVQCILIAAWYQALSGVTTEPEVYNSSAHKLITITAGQIIKLGYICTEEVPLNGIIWKPNGNMTKCRVWYYLNVIFLHLIPGLLIDGFLKFRGRKPQLVRLHQRIYVANMALSFFMTKTWKFSNDKMMWLRTQVLPCDKKAFNLDSPFSNGYKDFFRNAIVGSRKYLLREHVDTLPHAKMHYRRIYWLEKGVHLFTMALFLWFEYRNAFLQSTVLGIVTSVFR